MRSATDKLSALTECTVAVQTDTGTQTELTHELTPELTPEVTPEQNPELTHQTEYTDPPDRCTQTADVLRTTDAQTQTLTLTQTHWDPDAELRQSRQQHEAAWVRAEVEIEKLREGKAVAEKEVQRCYDFDEQIQTHHVAVNRQIAEATATEIKRMEAALQEAKKKKDVQQEKVRKARNLGGAAGHDEMS